MKSSTLLRLLSGPFLAVVLSLASAGTARAAGPYQFQPITPCRIVDTRNGLGGYTGLILNGQTVKFPIRGAAPCNVPPSAAAVAVNMTVADTANPGWVALFPGDQAWPGVSNINFQLGDFLANAAVVPLSTSNTYDISVLAAFVPGAEGTNVILDVTGYFVPSGGLKFYPILPCRIVNTQTGLGGFTGFLPNGLPGTKFTIKGAAPCNIPTDAVAVAVNATVANTQNQGYVALFPGNASWPGVSNVNFFANDTIANGALIPVSPGSQDLTVLAVFAPGPSGAYLQLDLTGYFK
jgi:hypothetical protein